MYIHLRWGREREGEVREKAEKREEEEEIVPVGFLALSLLTLMFVGALL